MTSSPRAFFQALCKLSGGSRRWGRGLIFGDKKEMTEGREASRASKSKPLPPPPPPPFSSKPGSPTESCGLSSADNLVPRAFRWLFPSQGKGSGNRVGVFRQLIVDCRGYFFYLKFEVSVNGL